MLINYLIILMLMLVSIAFFTIMERKMLGILHLRLGPSKVGLMGLFQPFSDAIKLFSKSMNNIMKSNEMYWNMSPAITFMLLMILIMFIPMKSENLFINKNLMIMIFIFGLPNFSLFWSSFFSFSKFSIISSKRCISQLISYEMGLMFFLISIIFLMKNMNLNFMIMIMYKMYINKFILVMIMFIILLSESSRIPFDFIEGESELVSGFNIEYSSIYFSLFFIYEYGMMLFFCILMSMMLMKFFLSFILIFLFILIRASFIRIRYDQMMMFIWKMIYPLIIPLMIFMNYF